MGCPPERLAYRTFEAVESLKCLRYSDEAVMSTLM